MLPGLDVGANPHGLGGANEHRHRAVPARCEELGLGDVGLGVLHVADRAVVDAAANELSTEFVIRVPSLGRGGGDVAEHELQGTWPEGELVAVVGVAVVACGVVDCGDPLGGHGQLAALGGWRFADESEVERGPAAVARDLQHVVLAGIDGPVADALCAGCEVGDVVDEDVAGFDDDGLGLTVGEGRDGEVEVVVGADISDLPVEGEQLGDVLEPGEPGLHPVGSTVGCELQGGVGATEVRGPRVEGSEVDAGEQVGVQVGLHDPQLGH